jgi:hypothetical protein
MIVQYDISLNTFTMEPNIEPDPCDLTIFDGIQTFWIDDGCQSNTCLVRKPPYGYGHNGGCECFRKIPKELLIQCKKDFYKYKNDH